MPKNTVNINSKRNVLIVGCGDLGQQLSTLLPTEHFRCVGLKRSDQPLPPPLETLQGDITQTQTARSLFHANQPRWHYVIITLTPSERSDAGYRDSYVKGVDSILKALEGCDIPPKLIVFASSTAVYSQNSGQSVDEQSETTPERFNGQRLLEAELRLKHSSQTSVSLRFGGIYGPGRTRALSACAERIKSHNFSNSGNIANRIHSHDCARIFAHMIHLKEQNQPLAPQYLCVDNLPCPNQMVEQWLSQALNISYPEAFALEPPSNKQGNNQLLRETGFNFRYPSFMEGYGELLDGLDKH